MNKIAQYYADYGHLPSAHAATNSIKGQREMSAADLGLRCNCDRIDCAPCHQSWLRSFVSPYAFWLGADA